MERIGGSTIEVIRLGESKYPRKLINIKNPPKQLYLQGNIDLLKSNIIAIVGSRNCSQNGRKLAEKFTKELVEQGITIASGLASGIDTIAHKVTLDNNGKTIAVLGNGFNHIFPKENLSLYNKIIESEGLIISEYTPDTKAESKNFVNRNRIVSGISIGILVVEAAYRSGTSITARYAIEQEKKVFVLPHEIDNKYGVGTNQLIRKGCTLITSTKEIIDEFNFLKYREIRKEPIKKENKNLSKIIGNDINEIESKKYQKVYELITEKIISIDEICEKTKINLKEINNILFLLEIKGIIRKVAGGYTCILNKE